MQQSHLRYHIRVIEILHDCDAILFSIYVSLVRVTLIFNFDAFISFSLLHFRSRFLLIAMTSFLIFFAIFLVSFAIFFTIRFARIFSKSSKLITLVFSSVFDLIDRRTLSSSLILVKNWFRFSRKAFLTRNV